MLANLSNMAVVVTGKDLGELLDVQLSALRVEPRAPPRRVGQRAKQEERVLPQPPELLHDGRGIGLGVFQLPGGPVVVDTSVFREVPGLTLLTMLA